MHHFDNPYILNNPVEILGTTKANLAYMDFVAMQIENVHLNDMLTLQEKITALLKIYSDYMRYGKLYSKGMEIALQTTQSILLSMLENNENDMSDETLKKEAKDEVELLKIKGYFDNQTEAQSEITGKGKKISEGFDAIVHKKNIEECLKNDGITVEERMQLVESCISLYQEGLSMTNTVSDLSDTTGAVMGTLSKELLDADVLSPTEFSNLVTSSNKPLETLDTAIEKSQNEDLEFLHRLYQQKEILEKHDI